MIGFQQTAVKVHPKEKYVSVRVVRSGHCDAKASVFYCTEEVKDSVNAALEVEDFEPIKKAELDFDKGEIEKTIEIKLIEKDEYELEEEQVYLMFRVRLF